MNSIPQIRLIFVLTKKDSSDFDRDSVTRHLCINPSKTSAPIVSKGRLNCDVKIPEIEKEFSGLTILSSDSPPYKMIKHSYWSIELPKIESWDLRTPLQQLEKILIGKEHEILKVCRDYDLNADLIVRIFAKSQNMPELTISNDSLSFWTSIGASIGFDFYLD